MKVSVTVEGIGAGSSSANLAALKDRVVAAAEARIAAAAQAARQRGGAKAR